MLISLPGRKTDFSSSTHALLEGGLVNIMESVRIVLDSWGVVLRLCAMWIERGYSLPMRSK
ncbi:MAG: hypothetical protein ACTJLK_00860 [Anaplasma sp.]